MELDPGNSEVLAAYGASLSEGMGAGKRAKAEAYLFRAVELAPSNTQARNRSRPQTLNPKP